MMPISQPAFFSVSILANSSASVAPPVLSSIIVFPPREAPIPPNREIVCSCDAMHVIVAGLANTASSAEFATFAPAETSGCVFFNGSVPYRDRKSVLQKRVRQSAPHYTKTDY